jgi:catechol 2,3-dioxygenase-like lactoylglutathione lyase family enzyme
MSVLRPHLSLTVTDVTSSIPFYEALFGASPEKVRPGYAKFSVAAPALNFTLVQGERGVGLGAFNHGGIQVAATRDVLEAKERLIAAGLAAFEELDTTCCYARQDKIWVRDPDGTPWEVFVVHEDAEEAGAGGLAVAEQHGCGCAGADDDAPGDTQCCSRVSGCCA